MRKMILALVALVAFSTVAMASGPRRGGVVFVGNGQAIIVNNHHNGGFGRLFRAPQSVVFVRQAPAAIVVGDGYSNQPAAIVVGDDGYSNQPAAIIVGNNGRAFLTTRPVVRRTVVFVR
jgi:hypothetical protein